MDNKAFTHKISKSTELDPKETAALVDSLCNIIATALVEQDDVVVPGFGNFGVVKHNETIVNDLSTGKKLLLPPSIEISFQPASALKKQF